MSIAYHVQELSDTDLTEKRDYTFKARPYYVRDTNSRLIFAQKGERKDPDGSDNTLS